MDFLFLWLVSFVIGFWINKKLRQWKNLPPGPWGLPVVGYLPFFDRNSPHLTLTKLAREYGPIYSIKMGSIPTVVLSDHKLIREAFAKEDFSGRAPLYLTHGIMKGNGIICAEGALWKDQRKLITTWLKSFGMSKHSLARDRLETRIASGVNELIQDGRKERMLSLIDAPMIKYPAKNVKETTGKPINLTEMVTNSLGNVVNDIIFGYKYPQNDKTWIWFRQIQEEGCHEMGVAGVVNFLPFLRFFMPSIKVTMEVLTRGQAQTHRLYASIIDKRRKLIGIPQPEKASYAAHENMFNEHPQGHIKCISYSKHSSNSEHYFDPDVLHASKDECILDNFLKEQKRRYDANEDSAKYMSDEQLVYLLADMFGAGLDTTSVTIAWYFLFMALYPEEQECVRKEIMTVCPDETDIIDHAKLPYMMATICETQRVRSIVPVGIPHGCVQDTYLGDYRIAKGTMVVPLQWAVHMDPSTWEEPEKFRPSRFLDEDGNLLKPQEFIPFQTGKRMCPGDELSRMISVGLIARFFKTFKLRLASDPPTEEEMMGKVGLTLSPPETKYFCDLI